MKLSAKHEKIEPQILFLNQSVGPLFLELAEAVANHFGHSRLVTGTLVRSRNAALTTSLLAAYNRRNLFTRAWSWLLFVIQSCREIWKVSSKVPLFVVSNPPLLPWLALTANLLRRQPYILLVYDIYPDILVALGRLGRNRLVTRAWRKLNQLACRRALYVVTLGNCMAGRLESYFEMGAAEKKLIVIPTWADVDKFVPLDKECNPFAMALGQQDHLTILYSGNIGFSHDIRLLIDAAERLQDSSILHFVIIGEGQGKAELEKRVSIKGFRNVTFLPFQPIDILPYSLAMGDVAVISIGQGAEGLMMPSKTQYAMAVGSALVGLSQSPNDLADIITGHGCGINVALDDLEGLVAALRRFESDRDYLTGCRKAARDAAVKHFSRAINTRRFIQLISSALGSKCEEASV